MKVAIVQESLDVRRGGAETAVLEMARRLTDIGHDVTVLSRESASTTDAAPIRSFPTTGGKLARTRRFLRQIAEHCRTTHYDVVHAVTPTHACDVYQPRGGTFRETVRRSLAASPKNRALHALGKRLNLRQRFLQSIENKLLTHSAPPIVACVSDYVRRHLLADYPQVAGNAIVVYNGVDIDRLLRHDGPLMRDTWRKRLAIRDEERLLLFVAHNFKLKGLDPLLQALPRVTQTCRLVVVGRGKRDPYQRIAARIGVDAQLQFVDDPDAVPALYHAADLLCHPTWYDPCSRVVLEALCCGLPAVTTRWNGAAEALTVGRTGFVIDQPDDSAALARAIMSGLGLRETARAHADNACQQLSMTRHVQALAAVYERVAQSGPSNMRAQL